MKPLVSIIIPVYQVEKYLDKCIASVVGQTYQNLQIITAERAKHIIEEVQTIVGSEF